MAARQRWKPPVIPAAEDLRALLRARYDHRKGWILMFEVRSHTGYAKGSGRFADALALNVWPSAGLVLHGFEIKVSRHDLDRELRAEGKDEIKQHCDGWWLVVPDLALLEGFQLPADWGVMVTQGRRLVVHKEAPQRARSPWPRDFCTSLVRNAAENSAQLDEQKKLNESAEERGRQLGLERAQRDREELAQLHEKIDALGEAAGDRCLQWASKERWAEIGKVLGASQEEVAAVSRRRDLLEQLERAAAALRDAIPPSQGG